jgi:L-2,4-diaminobutyrate decarboxylase
MNNRKEMKIFSGASSDEIQQDLLTLIDFQAEKMSLEELSKILNKQLIPHLVNYNHPYFLSCYNFLPEAGARLGAELALKYNQGVTGWQVSPGGAILEEMCCQALCRLFGLSSKADATFMYCGTYSNQSALYLALHWMAEKKYGFDFGKQGIKGFPDPNHLVAITSFDAHLSLKHALRVMGLGEDSYVTVPVDKNRRMDIEKFKETLIRLNEEKDIFCVIVTAGTTSTGSVDPILPIVNLCNELNIWCHVDAAFGLSYYLVPEKKFLFNGIELADSITWDPHKTFGVPIPNSLLFLKRKEDFWRHSIFGDYFNRKDDPEPNPGLKSPPTTRPFSALPLVTSIRYLGLDGIVNRLKAHFLPIQAVYEKLKNDKEIELFHKPDLGILCFRVTPKNIPTFYLDQLQRAIFERIKYEGKYSISLTKLGQKWVIRLVVLNEAVTATSIMETIKYTKKIAYQYLENFE